MSYLNEAGSDHKYFQSSIRYESYIENKIRERSFDYTRRVQIIMIVAAITRKEESGMISRDTEVVYKRSSVSTPISTCISKFDIR